jgi:hypothetical protein
MGVGAHHLAGADRRERAWIEWGCNLIVHKLDTAFTVEGILEQVGALCGASADIVHPHPVPFPFGDSKANDAW